MKIFITGTTGFIGKSLKEFYEPNHTVIEYIRGTDIIASLIGASPDVIINCAGEIYNADLMYDTNVGLVHEILQWLRVNPNTKLIQIGSSSEYGTLSHPSSEVDRINPIDVYQATKGAATLLCQGYGRQFGLKTVVARVYSAYGAHERPRRLFPHLYDAYFNNKPMDLYDGVHDFIYIDDFMRGIDIMIKADTPSGEIVNFGSGYQITNREVCQAWSMATDNDNAPVTIKEGYIRSFDTQVWQCDTRYAEEKYGFKTQFTLEEGIKDFIRKKKNGR